MEDLIRQYREKAKKVAWGMAKKYNTLGLGEDLESHAMIGLVQAAERYDSSKGIPFWAFASRRVKGEIIDGLELWIKTYPGDIIEHWDSTSNDPSPRDSAQDNQLKEHLLSAIMKIPITEDRKVIYLYYFRGLTLREISDIFNVTKMRIVQRKARGLDELRRRATSLKEH